VLSFVPDMELSPGMDPLENPARLRTLHDRPSASRRRRNRRPGVSLRPSRLLSPQDDRHSRSQVVGKDDDDVRLVGRRTGGVDRADEAQARGKDGNESVLNGHLYSSTGKCQERRTQVSGLFGDEGDWSKCDADFLRSSVGRDRPPSTLAGGVR